MNAAKGLWMVGVLAGLVVTIPGMAKSTEIVLAKDSASDSMITAGSPFLWNLSVQKNEGTPSKGYHDLEINPLLGEPEEMALGPIHCSLSFKREEDRFKMSETLRASCRYMKGDTNLVVESDPTICSVFKSTRIPPDDDRDTVTVRDQKDSSISLTVSTSCDLKKKKKP